MSTIESEWPIRIELSSNRTLPLDSTNYAYSPFSDEIINLTITPHHNFVALSILPLLCVTGLLGNVLVCIAIWTDRRLHNVTNYFLFSLALADLLVCTVVMPLAILVEVKQGNFSKFGQFNLFFLGMWIWSFGLCLLYTYADVFLCSASIVHISVISLDRYLGISRPLKLRNKSRTIVVLKICFVWVMTIIISCPLAALAIIEPGTILEENMCTIRSRHYMIYGSTLSFLIPFVIMTITFTKTTQLLNSQANALSQRTAEGQNGNNGLRRTVMQHKKLVYTRTNSYNSMPVQQQNRTPLGKRLANGMTLQMSPLVKYQSASADYAQDEKDLNIERPYFNNVSTDTEDDSILEAKLSVSEKPNNDREVSQEFQQLKNHLQRNSTRIRSQFNRVRARLMVIARRKKEKTENTNTELANEHKATRVLAVVFACFFVCWGPFFIMNFILGFCGDQCGVPAWLSSIILWLGYLSSTLNPVIYTTFNRRFREAFLRIIRCQCLKSREGTYSRNHVFLTGGDATWTCVDKSAIIYNPNRENTFISQNGSPKIQWINYSINRRQVCDRNRVRAILSTSSSGSSKIIQSTENLNSNRKNEIPGILLSKPLVTTKIKNRSVTSLEEFPEPTCRLLGSDIGFSANRRFSATASIFSSFESTKLSKSQTVLRSTPTLTISNYDEEQEKMLNKNWATTKRIVNYYDQKSCFTPKESIPNIDDESESGESSEFESLIPTMDQSQASILPHPYFN